MEYSYPVPSFNESPGNHYDGDLIIAMLCSLIRPFQIPSENAERGAARRRQVRAGAPAPAPGARVGEAVLQGEGECVCFYLVTKVVGDTHFVD